MLQAINFRLTNAVIEAGPGLERALYAGPIKSSVDIMSELSSQYPNGDEEQTDLEMHMHHQLENWADRLQFIIDLKEGVEQRRGLDWNLSQMLLDLVMGIRCLLETLLRGGDLSNLPHLHFVRLYDDGSTHFYEAQNMPLNNFILPNGNPLFEASKKT